MENKPDYHVVSFSGGKDSTAMLLRMLEDGKKVDEILFCDTGLEFPQMYEHIRKVEQNIGRKIKIVKSDYSFEYLFLEKRINRRKEALSCHNGYSWAGPLSRWCTEHLKNGPRERYLRELRKKYNVIQYVGIAADETHRINRPNNQRADVRLPLVEWNMSEADCLAYCYAKGYDWGGLYEKFQRVSCWCCPLQSLKELRILYRNFPELWKQLKVWDDKTWRTFKSDGWSVRKLEERFDFEAEWALDGKPLRSKEFYKALRNRITAFDI